MTTSPKSRGAQHLANFWYLGYLVILVFQPLFDPDRTWVDWILTAAAAAVFVPVYVVGELRTGRIRQAMPWVATTLGLLVLTFNVGGGVFLIYAGAAAASHQPRQQAMRWLVGLSALTTGLAVISPVPMLYRAFAFVPVLLFLWVVGMACMDDRERAAEAARLRVDNARIAHLATATERERIARDLHDLTGHSLTSIVVRAQLVQRLAATDPQRAAAEAAEIETVARDALGEIRETVAGWRQVVLDDEVEVARQALERVGVRLHVDVDRDVHLAPSVEQALGLALREGVTNVVRHAGAHACTVRLSEEDGQVRLEVVDDGVGAAGEEGNGLLGMRERMAALGGQVQRISQAGTRLVVTVPQDLAG